MVPRVLQSDTKSSDIAHGNFGTSHSIILGKSLGGTYGRDGCVGRGERSKTGLANYLLP